MAVGTRHHSSSHSGTTQAVKFTHSPSRSEFRVGRLPLHAMQHLFSEKSSESVKLFPKHVTYQESDWLLQIT
jgi:hypothetical protein